MKISNKKLSLLALIFLEIVTFSSLNVILLPIVFVPFVFFGLTLFPGLLLLYVLKVNTSAIRRIVYSVGLSISLLLFLGLIDNMLLPFIGIIRPLSIYPVLILNET